MSSCEQIEADPERRLSIHLWRREAQGSRDAPFEEGDAHIALQTTPRDKPVPARKLAALACTGSPDVRPLEFSNRA